MYWNPPKVEVIHLSREDLYEKVWSEPMRTLALKYGLSDVGLVKICKKYKIPRPGLGFWAKKEHGKKVRKTPLPRYDGPTAITIHKRENSPGVRDLPDPIIRGIAFEKDPENRIVLCSDLRKSHPLVRQAKTVLETAGTDDFERLVILRKECLDIRVSKSSVRRSLLLMESVLEAFKIREFEVRISKDRDSKFETHVIVHGQEIQIALDEKLCRKEKPMGPMVLEFHRLMGEEDPKWYTFGPTGLLRLQILETTRSKIKKHWVDTPKRQIEDCLNEFMMSLVKVSNDLRLQEEERAKRDEERRQQLAIEAEVRRKEEEIRSQKEAEKKKIEDLKDMARRWQESRLIRSFLDDAENRARAIQGEGYEQSDMKKYVDWGRVVAVSLDPLKNESSSV